MYKNKKNIMANIKVNVIIAQSVNYFIAVTLIPQVTAIFKKF